MHEHIVEHITSYVLTMCSLCAHYTVRACTELAPHAHTFVSMSDLRCVTWHADGTFLVNILRTFTSPEYGLSTLLSRFL